MNLAVLLFKIPKRLRPSLVSYGCHQKDDLVLVECTLFYFLQECVVFNESMAQCIFPEMHLPDIDSNRLKRNTQEDRNRQQAMLNKYKFYIGIKMDGVKSYKNISKVSSTDGFLVRKSFLKESFITRLRVVYIW